MKANDLLRVAGVRHRTQGTGGVPLKNNLKILGYTPTNPRYPLFYVLLRQRPYLPIRHPSTSSRAPLHRPLFFFFGFRGVRP